MVNGRAAWVALLTGVAGIVIGGCVNFSALDDLETANPPANRFNQALYEDYSFLARSFGDVGEASYTSFDQDASYSLAQTPDDVAGLANAFAAKALQLSKGEQVDPEPSRDIKTHEIRDRLVRALNDGRDTFPRDAARAQADFDCWQLNNAVATQAAAAQRCRQSLDVSLPRLEAEVATIAKATPAQPKKAPSASEPVLDQSDF